MSNIKKLVTELSQKLADGDKFFTGRLAIRLAKAAQLYPSDSTIGQMASFLNKRASAPAGHLITRAELKCAYDAFYANNTKCGSVLSSELGIHTEESTVKKIAHRADEGQDLYESYIDPVLAKELNCVFDKTAKYAPYSESVAKQAESACRRVLGPQPKINTVDGRDFAIICSASFETPKGKVDVIIPVDVINSQALLPTVFLSNAGFTDLTADNLKNYIIASAGKQFRVDASQLFEVIKVAKFGPPKSDINTVEHALMMMRHQSKTADVNIKDAILLQSIDPEEQKKETSPESQLFGSQMASVAGEAEFVFGKRVVATAHNFILNDLLAFGYKNPIIKLNGFKEYVLDYVVSIGGAGFKIPVKVKQGRVVPPSLLFANGAVESFSKDGVKKALGTNDTKHAAVALGYNLDSPGQLLEVLKKACVEKDYTKASEVIAVVGATGDRKALAYAFSMYTDALGGNLKVQAERKIPTIKIGGNEVCAQTYLPVDRVYMDENGVCHPKYRQNQEHTEPESGAFSYTKILKGF